MKTTRENSFVSLTVFPAAMRLLTRTPALWKWSLPPIVLSLMVVLILFHFIRQGIDHFLSEFLIQFFFAKILASFPLILSITTSLFHLFSTLLTIFLFSITFSWIFILLSIPFCDPLANATEKALGIHPSFDKNFKPLSGFRIFWIDFKKSICVLLLQVLTLVFCLIFFWIPGIQILAFLVNSGLMAFQFLSYPQTRRGLGLRESFQALQENPILYLSFGIFISILYLIPYLSSFLTPIAVIAGTILYAKVGKKEQSIH